MDETHRFTIEWTSYGDGDVTDLRVSKHASGGPGGRIIRRNVELFLTESECRALIERLESLHQEMTEPEDTDDDIPFNVREDCPDCGTEATVRWPPDDPDAVEVRCIGCGEKFEVERSDGG